MMRLVIIGVLTLLLFVESGCKKKEVDLKVMTFNIRYDNPRDKENNWNYRKQLVTETISDYDADVWGGQEALHHQLNDILQACPGYAYIGVGRADGKTKGEYSPLFYRRSKFSVEKSGTFWLSESPDVPGSKGWDAACERVVSWAILKTIDSGKKCAFFNTHFDHMGKVAQKESARLLANKINTIAGDLPIVVMGDFNVIPGSEPLSILIEEGNLLNVRDFAKTVNGPSWSYHNFGRLSEEDRILIDHFLVNKQVKVQNYQNIFKTKDSLFISDHNPLIINIRY